MRKRILNCSMLNFYGLNYIYLANNVYLAEDSLHLGKTFKQA